MVSEDMGLENRSRQGEPGLRVALNISKYSTAVSSVPNQRVQRNRLFIVYIPRYVAGAQPKQSTDCGIGQDKLAAQIQRKPQRKSNATATRISA